MKRLEEYGENEVVMMFRDWLRPAEGQPEFLGDDCAVIPVEGSEVDQLLTSDAVVEGVHFTSDTDPDRIGQKAVNRTLSDIAANGGLPTYCLMNVGAPRDMPVDALKALMVGARNAASAFGAVIVGGDLTHMDAIEVHVFCQGIVPAGQAILRSGGAPGDALYVTGRLGGSLEGHHLDFIPRIKEAMWLRENVKPTAMMDLSDGLAMDLPRLALESDVGARVDLEALPISPSVNPPSISAAMGDGEDYELLFSVSALAGQEWEDRFRKDFDVVLTRIGEVVSVEEGLTLSGKGGITLPWPTGGYEHFA